MSQLTIKLSDKADALIAQLQKEIFNRRRKKVSASGVVETLVESGAKSQSDKRFATSWTNLIKDIEKAAKLAYAHGSKPSTLSDEEWALVLSHRSRSSSRSSSKASSKATNGNRVAGTRARRTVKKKVAAQKPARRTRTRSSVSAAATEAATASSNGKAPAAIS
ncbi:protein family PM-3 [Synechococcus sp. KORDI-100]|uniref:hypothetical protein n=1 Tax=Synechococcus sp. KORDI-100 TaxID=1280380 RepID=UPI0004E084B1|nr:hypothetical protein [Synechococcus sp. KORDI-100]AII42344.1 protein family PM-3 [Synechococcus sp. KORDI-100]